MSEQPTQQTQGRNIGDLPLVALSGPRQLLLVAHEGHVFFLGAKQAVSLRDQINALLPSVVIPASGTVGGAE